MKQFFSNNLSHPSIPFWCLAVTTLLVGSTFPLHASLWLDETLTAWVSNSSFSATVTRARFYQGQPPLYFAFIWLLRVFFEDSELLFRAPSLIAAIGSLFLLYHIARQYCSANAATFAPLFLVANDEFQKFAMTARPYMLALFFSLLAILFVIRSQRKKSTIALTIAIASLVVSIYLHPVFLVFAAVPALFLLLERPEGERSFVQLLGAIVSVAVLACPLIYQMAALAARKEQLFFASVPDATRLFKALFPPFPVVAFLTAAICSAIFFKSFRLSVKHLSLAVLSTSILWLLLGPLLYFFHAQYTGDSLFIARIFFWRVPALALVTALLVNQITPILARHFVFLLFSFLTITGYSMRPWHLENWREAVHESTQNPEGSVALFSGLIELNSLSWVTDPAHHAYLTAPFSHYSPTFAATWILPRAPHTPAAQQYLQQYVFPKLQDADWLVFLQTYRHDEPRYHVHQKILEAVAAAGFETETISDTGLVKTYKILRPNNKSKLQ